MKSRGRPTKLTRKLMNVLKAILEPASKELDTGFIVLTDDALVQLINERLEPEERISKRTFEEWKTGNNLSSNPDNEAILSEFMWLIKKAMHTQRKFLLEKLTTEKNQWQRWAWILERKFDEWNLKKKVGADVVTTQTEKPSVKTVKSLKEMTTEELHVLEKLLTPEEAVKYNLHDR